MSRAMNFQIVYGKLKDELIRRGVLRNDEKLSLQEMVYLCGKDFYYSISSSLSDKPLSWSEFDEEAVRSSLISKGYRV